MLTHKPAWTTPPGVAGKGPVKALLFLFLIGPLAMSAAPVMAQSEYTTNGYMYLSPQPGGEYLSTGTRYILVRFLDVAPNEITNLTNGFMSVTGSSSGNHPGQTRVASDGRTVIFEISSTFWIGEMVTVDLEPVLDPGASGNVTDYSYQFMVSTHFPGPPPPARALRSSAPETDPATATDSGIGSDEPSPPPTTPPPGASPLIMSNGVSVPSDFPCIAVTTQDNPDPGYIFINNWGGQPYNVIFDNSGNPIWYLRTPDRRRDFKVQRNGWMTMLVREGYPNGPGFIAFDTNYVEVAYHHAVNGHETDEHEFVMLEDGSYLLLGLNFQTVDMGRYVSGGQSSATVAETVIQEFTATGDLIFQWRGWDHYDIADIEVVDPTGSYIAFPHMNAIEVDVDGHLLVSCRHLGEVTKINRDTGDILWRLGGAHNEFTFVGDTLNGFNAQHAIRTVATNRYTLFDNGNLHSPPLSRAVEYELDTSNMMATVVWEYRHVPSYYSYFMGNVQRLPNGNTLINWVLEGLPKLTEVRPDGTKAFEMNWVDQHLTYRTWRHPWEGRAITPYLLVEPAPDNVTLIFNQFGDPAVDYYRIYAGTSPAPTNLVGTSTTTVKELTNVTPGQVNYFRVTSVSTNGMESDFSNEESLLVTFVPPNQNMVPNGDFSAGTADWIFQLQGSGNGAWSVEDGVAHLAIADGGGDIFGVQIRQAGLPLLQGRDYYFAFDAWAVAPRILEVKVAQDTYPYINYSGITPFTISPVNTRYEYRFTMNDPSDFNSRIVFNAGLNTADVYIDNVTLILLEYAPGDINEDGCVNGLDLEILTDEWLMNSGLLQADLDLDGIVNFEDYAILMENWSEGPLCP